MTMAQGTIARVGTKVGRIGSCQSGLGYKSGNVSCMGIRPSNTRARSLRALARTSDGPVRAGRIQCQNNVSIETVARPPSQDAHRVPCSRVGRERLMKSVARSCVYRIYEAPVACFLLSSAMASQLEASVCLGSLWPCQPCIVRLLRRALFCSSCKTWPLRAAIADELGLQGSRAGYCTRACWHRRAPRGTAKKKFE